MSKINKNQVQDNSIDSTKVEDDSLTSADVQNETLKNEDIANDAGIELKKLDNTGATIGDFVRLAPDGIWKPLPQDAPNYSSTAQTIGTTSSAGTATTVARGDHVHAHGMQTDGTLHAIGTTDTPGFISTTDKTNLNAAYSHTSATNNPHSVTKDQVGLNNVDNTSDANKPISTATQTALNGKEDAFAKSTAFNKNFGTGTITTIGTTASLGTSTDIPRFDHVHPHGIQTDETLHALATTSAHGFLSAADKQRLDEFVAVGAISDQRFRVVQRTVTTTSSSYISYDTWTTNTVDAGTYLVRWFFTMRTQSYQTPGQYTVFLDGTNVILDYTMAAAYNETEAIAAAGVAQITFSTDATHTFEVRFKRIGSSSRRVHLLGSYMELVRVV